MGVDDQPRTGEAVRTELLGQAVYVGTGASAAAVVTAVLLDATVREAVGWVAVGAAIAGVLHYVFDDRKRVPRAELPPLPSDVTLERPRRFDLGFVLGAVVFVLAAIVLVQVIGDRDVVLRSFVGAVLGYALAPLIAAAQVARWERRHGATVVAVGEEPDLYAAPRLGL